jgi:hypothetical protein
MIRLITSAISEKDILKATKSNTPVIFLGGNCTDNSWRKEIEEELGGDLYLLDPFDMSYDPAKNTYKEIAGMINSDYAIFYKGGKQSDREKDFLDLIGTKSKLIKEFDDLMDLKKFLRGLKGKKLESISSKLKKCAGNLTRESSLYFHNNEGKVVDLFFEKLDDKSIENVINDLLAGKTVTLPAVGENWEKATTLNIKDVKPEEVSWLKLYIVPGSNPPHTSQELIRRAVPLRPAGAKIFRYDPTTQSYIDKRLVNKASPELASEFSKTAKKNQTYEHSCTKVNLPEDLSKAIIKWGKDNISEEDLYIEDGEAKGREDDIHVTVFYGIKDDNPAEVAELFSKLKPFDIRLGLINLFKDKKEYDVLKIEVESGDLEKLHYDIEKGVDTENTYPTYNPHVTVGYVKKGTADKFVGDESFKGKTFKVKDIAFSDGKGVDLELPLGI